MSLQHEIEGLLSDWRHAERRRELAIGPDAVVIEREIAYYRSQYRAICAAQTDAAVDDLRAAEEHLGLSLRGPSTSSGAR